jgi:hypothetical protein
MPVRVSRTAHRYFYRGTVIQRNLPVHTGFDIAVSALAAFECRGRQSSISMKKIYTYERFEVSVELDPVEESLSGVAPAELYGFMTVVQTVRCKPGDTKADPSALA